MSNVSTKYSTSAASNAKLGAISLKENETRYRDLNDLFRLLMADARQESNEVRGLIASAASKAATAQAAANSARGEVNEIAPTLAGIRTEAQAARQTAENAENAAENAASSASQSASQAASAAAAASAVQIVANNNQTAIASLENRVTTLESAAASGSGVSQVDGVTVDYGDGDLTAIDVAVGGDIADLASARGQIGRAAIAENADVNALLSDGWYAVGGANVINAPEGTGIGVIRASSGFAESSVFQTFFAFGETPRLFIRTYDGTNFSSWREPLFSTAVGNGLAFHDGVISADLSSVLPAAGEADYGRCLSGAGTWIDVATPEDLDAVGQAVNSFAQNIEEIRTALAAVEAQTAAEPDGTTVMVVDGQYTVPTYLGATAEADGVAGLVPAAEAGGTDLFLRSDGTWASTAQEQPDYAGATEEEDGTAGLVPAALASERYLYLRGDGTWGDPASDLASQIEDLVAAAGGSSGGSGDMQAMTAADVDWIVLGIPPVEPEPETEPEEQEGGE